MKEYPKTQTVFKRDPETNLKKVLLGVFADPVFEYLQYCNWVWTEKVDGTNIRVIYTLDEVAFKGRTDRAEIPRHLLNALTETFPINLIKERHQGLYDLIQKGHAITLYGEGYGPKIQSGGKYRTTPGFVLFDIAVTNIITNRTKFMGRNAIEDIASILDIEIVPIVGEGNLWEMVESTPALKSTWGDFIAEGIVAFPKIPLYTEFNERIRTKIKAKDF